MVTRTISKDKYLLAGVLTFLIFSLGLTLGVIIDNARLKALEHEAKEQEIDFASLQFQYLYLTSIDNEGESCPVLQTALDKSVAELGKTLEKLMEYKKDSQLNQKSYTVLGRKYLLDNLQYWFFAKKSKQKCDSDFVNILYFYSDQNCPICSDQGVLLTFFKKLYGEKLLIFPINVDLEPKEPMITIMKSRYAVDSYPTLVIGDTKYTGMRERGELSKLICNSFKNEDLCIKR